MQAQTSAQKEVVRGARCSSATPGTLCASYGRCFASLCTFFIFTLSYLTSRGRFKISDHLSNPWSRVVDARKSSCPYYSKKPCLAIQSANKPEQRYALRATAVLLLGMRVLEHNTTRYTKH